MCFLKFANLNLILNEMKVMTRDIKKNSYLSGLNSVQYDLKVIGKLFQRSTTSLLMTSSNSIDFEDELRFEVRQFCFKIFLKLFDFTMEVYQEVDIRFADFRASVDFNENSMFQNSAY